MARILPNFRVLNRVKSRLRRVAGFVAAAMVYGAVARSVEGQNVPDLRRRADSLASSGRDDELASAAYLQLGLALESVEDLRPALAAYARGNALAERARDSLGLANLAHRVGLLYWRASQYDSALVHLEVAKRLRLAIDDQRGLSAEYNSIGASFYQLGVYEPALEAFLQALTLRRAAGDSAGVARTLTNIGKTYHDWRQYSRAREMLEMAVTASRHSDSPAAVGYALNTLAQLEIDLGRFNEARRLLRESIEAYGQPGALPLRADTLDAWTLNAVTRALLLVREGQPAEALPVLDSVLRVGADRGSVRGQARTLAIQAEAHAAMGHRDVARRLYVESLRLARSVVQRVMALEALRHLASLEEEAGNSAQALRYLREYQALGDTIFDQAAAQRVASMEAREETQRAREANVALRARQAAQEAIIARQRLVVTLGALILLLVVALLAVLWQFSRRDRARLAVLSETNAELEQANAELAVALKDVRTLSGLIPICANCKNIRDDRGYWASVESYLAQHSGATFSHSICETCGPQLYGPMWKDRSDATNDANA
jgi:tetratricopeptide (TPR) repeat protein